MNRSNLYDLPAPSRFSHESLGLPTRRRVRDAIVPGNFKLHLTCLCGEDLRLRPREGAQATCKECGSVARFLNNKVSLEAKA